EVIESRRTILRRETAGSHAIRIREVFRPYPRILETQTSFEPLRHLNRQRMVFAARPIRAIEHRIEIRKRTLIPDVSIAERVCTHLIDVRAMHEIELALA